MMNPSLLRQTSSGFSKLSTHTTAQKYTISNQKIKTNPQQQIKTSNPNEPLLKIILFDNGNPVKDCKAILDSIKQENFDQKQKLTLFYQENIYQLLQNIKINHHLFHSTHAHKINKEITSKIKHLKLKRQNQTFQNYSKLMTHSLREHEKMKFLQQSSKINQSEDKKIPTFNKSPLKHRIRNASAKLVTGSSLTVLDRMMLEKRNQLAIQSSSMINKEQNDLETIMKNRAVCQKILEEALMFERYFDILKKEKQKILEENSHTPKNFRAKVSEKGEKRKYFGKSAVKKLNNPNGIVKLNMRSNDFCVNPKHLRLNDNKSKSMNHFDTEQDYSRNKYMVKLKRDEYLKQINRINEEFVEKRNSKNNVLISSLMAFIRNNATTNDQQEKVSKKHSRSNFEDDNSNLRNQLKPIQKQNVKDITGPGLTRILRRLFLIYSFMKTQESGSDYESLICKQNLDIFLKNFKIDIRGASKNNHKIRQILEKEAIDQFEFIQFIHVLSSMQSYHFDNAESQQNFIYTNINKWVGKKILHPSYEVYLSLEEERLLKKYLKKELEKLRKLNRFEDKILKVIDIFIEEESINKLIVPHLFEDFDYVLEVLWFMKIYPTYVNKRTVRFYFEYMKEDKGSLVLASLGLVSKNNSFALIQNIIWLVIAKASKQQLIACPQKDENELNESNVSIPKTLVQIFGAKFKTINKFLLHIIEAKNASKQHHEY